MNSIPPEGTLAYLLYRIQNMRRERLGFLTVQTLVKRMPKPQKDNTPAWVWIGSYAIPVLMVVCLIVGIFLTL